MVVISADNNYKKEINVEITELYLSSAVTIGDYVVYDAGVWSESKDKPISQGEFGGYTNGENKGFSVSWCNDSNSTTSLKGWRVLSKINTTVTLVHAGIPECYYHGTNQTYSLTKLNSRATSTYLNSTYAQSAHIMTYEEAKSITGSDGETTNNLRYIGSNGTTKNNPFYWLATAHYTTNLDYVYYDGHISNSFSSSYGVRPVVVLKDGIKTTGKGIDMVGQEAWILVEP